MGKTDACLALSDEIYGVLHVACVARKSHKLRAKWDTFWEKKLSILHTRLPTSKLLFAPGSQLVRARGQYLRPQITHTGPRLIYA